MAFSNPKEDVIDIQLTSYGKRLLSEGKLNPSFYSFLDDEIIYDYNYCNITESQNNIQTRIKENIRTECQSNFVGIETNILKVNKLIRSNTINFEDAEKLYNTLDNCYSFPASLGNSQMSSNYSPSWEVLYYNGTITGSVDYITGSYQLLRIPRLNSSIIFYTSIDFKGIPDVGNDSIVRPSIDGDNKIYSDGSYIKIEDDYILMEINEKNTLFMNDNFEIEVFEKKDISDSKISGSWTELIPLQFVKREKNLPPEQRLLNEEMNIDSSFVEYFFDVLVDDEIDERIFCDSIKKNKARKNIFIDHLPFKCDEENEQRDNQYYDIPDDGIEECD